MEVRLEYMRPTQIREARQRADLAFLPIGPLEWHGPQSPVGLDGLKAHHLSCRAAQILGGGAVFPLLYHGIPRDSFDVGRIAQYQEQFTATLGVEPRRFAGYTTHGAMDLQDQWLFFQKLLRVTFDSIAGYGFRSIYVVAGHAPLVHFIRPVAIAFARATQMAGLPVTVDWGQETEAAGIKGDHGGLYETSVMMATCPDSVDLQELQRHPELVGVANGADAVNSTLEQGRQWIEAGAQALAQEARWLVEHYPSQPPRHQHRR